MNFDNKYLLLFPVTLVLGVSACTVTKKYSRTDLSMPQQYRQEPAVTGDSVSLSWRTFFKDPILVALIDSALTRNSEVKTAGLTLEQLDLSYRQAKLSLLPSVAATISANRNLPSRNSLNGSFTDQFTGTKFLDDYNANLSLSWEADIWRKAALRKNGSRAEYLRQQDLRIALQTRVISEVAQAYYNLIGLDEQLAVAEHNIALSDSTYRMAVIQFNAGRVNSLAVEQLKAQKSTAQLVIPLLKQNLEIQENALSILCGNYPAAIKRSGSLAGIITEVPLAAGVPAHLLSRRVDVRAAESAVIAANAKTGLAKVAMYPSLSISAQSGVNAFKSDRWFKLPASGFYTVTGNLTQPIFNRKELKTSYKVAQLEEEKSVIEFRQTVLQAVGEVSDAMAKLTHVSDRLKITEGRRASLEKAVHDVIMLYNSGKANYLEVITAENNMLQNSLEVINIAREKLVAQTELYRALGGGTE